MAPDATQTLASDTVRLSSTVSAELNLELPTIELRFVECIKRSFAVAHVVELHEAMISTARSFSYLKHFTVCLEKTDYGICGHA
mmetsp:Transcript_10877/g.23201  ORF Transcript_10877/g.23201 Transcript_10877/m.23201 type:complete len:84 (+) Transcript_10877:1890-2141(+)